MNRKTSITALLLAGLLPIAALAATPIDETRSVNPDARVSVENVKGRISVTAWDRSEVHIGGSLGDGVERLEVDGGGDHLDIKVRYPQGGGWFGGGNNAGPSRLEIKVPRAAVLDLEGVSADIDVTGIDSEALEAESVSGNVSVDARVRDISVSSVSGDLDLSVDVQELSLETVSGDITAKGNITGSLRAEVVSGDLEIAAGELKEIRLTTVSGDVELRAALAASGRLSAESVSGDLDLRFPASLSAEIEAETFSGDITSPVGKVEKAGFGNGSTLEGRAGSGSARISLETFSGDIEIKLQ
ncbi:MAG: DUF4097 family beta strand repeat protein [Xanthomonadales bacterium]|nr:DUF4097 family beta strand repeat protein [Xanthomonadales bacterium]